MNDIETKERCAVAIRKLQAKGLSVPQIAYLINEKAICRRTVYRWLNSESSPNKIEYVQRLEELVKQL